MKRENKKIAKKIYELEQQIALGKDVEKAKRKIHNIIESLPKKDLFEIMMDVDEYILTKIEKEKKL